jgi:arylsulfatase A-like enzyme
MRLARALLFTLSLAACRGVVPVAQSRPTPSPPRLNLILVSMDALRYDRTGLGPSPTRWTPHLDRLARESVVFHQTVSAAPWTVPSHMAMWTARWPTRHGMVNKFRPDPATGRTVDATLDPSIETWPERLRASGYTLAAFTGGAGVSARFGFGRGFDTYVDDRRFAGMEHSLPPCLAWLQARVRAGERAPFFLFLHGYDVHGQHPLEGMTRAEVAPTYRGRLDGSIEENARLREGGLAVIRSPGDAASLAGVIDADDARFLRDVYDRKVEQADRRLGAFLDALRSLDLLDRSIVAVVSDHGDEFLEHGHFDHGHTLFEEQLHVVMMVRFPRGEGRRDVRAPVRTIDLFPTLFDALSLRGPDGCDGASLLPVARGATPDERPIFAETDYRLFVHHRMARMGDYKLILNLGNNRASLYHLGDDPGELHDLSASEPDRRAALERVLDDWLVAQGTRRDAFRGRHEPPITVF